MTTKTFTVKYRRKREGKTDYRKRLKLLAGKKTRLIVRISNKHIQLQAIDYKSEGDKILFTINTKELEKKGWKASTNNTTAAYLIGLIFAKRAKEKKILELIPDLGMQTTIKGGKLFAVLKGINDGGVKVPCAQEVYPSDNRIKGEHIAEYAKKIKSTEQYKKQFSQYLSKGLNPENLPQHFEELKKKI